MILSHILNLRYRRHKFDLNFCYIVYYMLNYNHLLIHKNHTCHHNNIPLLNINFTNGFNTREVQNARTLTRFYAFVKWENVAK